MPRRPDPSRAWSVAATPWIVRPGHEAAARAHLEGLGWNPPRKLPRATGLVAPEDVGRYFSSSATKKVKDYWTGETILVPRSIRPTVNGFTIYRGPSRIDGAPIVVIATGFRDPSTNRKTGPMIQTWIMREDVRPTEAVATGADRSICGDCPHRGGFGYRRARERRGGKTIESVVREGVKFRVGAKKKGPMVLTPYAKGRSCYVVVSQAPDSVWKSYHQGRCPFVPLERLPELFQRTWPLRVGSYGEPVAVPVEVWRAALSHQVVWTGYTHGWDRPENQAYRDFLMASVDSVQEQERAAQLGWRTFRIGTRDAAAVAGIEVVCPATPEGGSRTTCDSCALCMGTTKLGARSIVVAPHGTGARFFEEREVEDAGGGTWFRDEDGASDTYFPPGYFANPPEPVSHVTVRWVLGRWRATAYREGRPVGDSRDRWFPVDVAQFGPTRGSALEVALRDAFPRAQVQFLTDAQAARENPPTCTCGAELRPMGTPGMGWTCPRCMRWVPSDSRQVVDEERGPRCYDCQRAAPYKLGLCVACTRARAIRRPKVPGERRPRLSSDYKREQRRSWKGKRVRTRQPQPLASPLEDRVIHGTVVDVTFKGTATRLQVAWDDAARLWPSAGTSFGPGDLEVAPPGAGPLFDPYHDPRPNPGHPHPRIKLPVSRAQVEGELAHLHAEAGLPGVPNVAWPADLTRLHERRPRRYAQVWFAGSEPRFELAEQTRWLPEPQRIGVLSHEVGHVLDPTGGEDGADLAAEAALGRRITYDDRWAGRGLQTVRP